MTRMMPVTPARREFLQSTAAAGALAAFSPFSSKRLQDQADFKRTRSEGVCLSGGGCVAYYPAEIPFHHRSAWLGGRDVLGELVSGCRKLGMSVLVRTDPYATYDDLQAAHPDWIAIDADGKPRRHWASPEMWVREHPGSKKTSTFAGAVAGTARPSRSASSPCSNWAARRVIA